MGDLISKVFVDPKTTPNDFGGFVQLLYLAATYGYILCTASGWIGDGSELLLLIPSLAGVVGSVVLPILGAVPDGAIVLFSGLGDDAQEQLAVGIGALAGSTVMLLTVPWTLAVFAGRVVLNPDGTGRYKDKPKLDPPSRVQGTGVNCDYTAIGYAAKWMIGTSLTLIIIQVPAFTYKCGQKSQIENAQCDTNSEIIFAIIGLVMGTLGFIGYIADQVRLGGQDEASKDKLDQVRKKAVESGQLSLRGVFNIEEDKKVSKDDKDFRSIVSKFFHAHDVDSSGTIDSTELAVVMRDLGEPMDAAGLKDLLKQMDADGSGTIDLEEFIAAMADMVNRGYAPRASRMDGAHVQDRRQSTQEDVPPGPDGAEDGDDDSETEEIPEDLADLPPSVQRRRILQRAFSWMFGGLAVVMLFSDPLVDVLTEIGNRINVNPFYVSFILCPLASNASEIIAAYFYAAKKTPKTMTVSLSTLLGAACMNNTFCLVIFLVIIVAKKLKWEFSAETISIFVVEIIMYFVAIRKFHPTWMAFCVLGLLPLSLGLVVLLEAAGLN